MLRNNVFAGMIENDASPIQTRKKSNYLSQKSCKPRGGPIHVVMLGKKIDMLRDYIFTFFLKPVKSTNENKII